VEIKRLPVNAPYGALIKVAKRYAVAIERRGRFATDIDFLANVWRENGAGYVRQGRNWLIVHELVSGWYVASHFAPDTLKGGYKLLKSVHKSGLRVVFTVPEDLAVDLERIGWVRLPSWAATIASKLGLPYGKVLLTPKGMLLAALAVARSIEWRNLYRRDMFPTGLCSAICRRRPTTPKGPKARRKKPLPIYNLAEVWPE